MNFDEYHHKSSVYISTPSLNHKLKFEALLIIKPQELSFAQAELSFFI